MPSVATTTARKGGPVSPLPASRSRSAKDSSPHGRRRPLHPLGILDRVGRSQSASRFPSHVAEQLGYYVYALRDPNREDEIFYVGKGKGDRVFSHARAAQRLLEDVPNAKLNRIREIQASGTEVRIEILRHGLSEREAFEVEAVLIEMLRLDDLLLNLVAGQGKARGRMSIPDVLAMYTAQKAPRFPASLSAVLLRIPVLWYPSMPEDELYKATRGWWVIGPRRQRASYAFAVNRGVIREVYEVEEWRTAREGETEPDEVGRRWGFEGRRAGSEFDKYRNTSVGHLFKQGAANPVRYVNC